MAYQIAVLVRQVPDLNAARINHGTGEIQFSGQMVINSFDEYAIEEALRLKEEHGGEVTVISVGPSGARDAITRALAMGADKGILLQVDNAGDLDAFALSSVLASAVSTLTPDIVLLGQESDDYGSGEVGPILAELLGLPQVSSVVGLSVNGRELSILRDTDDGRQRVFAETPVVIMAAAGLNEPRYPSLKGIMAAKKKPVETIAPTTTVASKTGWSAPFPQARTSSGVLIEDQSPADAAKLLVDWLKENKLVQQ